jgi:hypothetical protein
VNISQAISKILTEHGRAISNFKRLNSPHEGHAVIREEFDELWDEVKRKQHDYAAMEKEAVQLGAMVIRFLTEVVDSPEKP